MKLRILGTAASEAWPALFCRCPACQKARELGGKNMRTRSSLQIEDQWKIDFPPDTLYHVHRFNLDLSKLKHLFFTHSHEDHMDTDEFLEMIPPFGENDFMQEPLNVYLSGDASKKFRARTEGSPCSPSVNLHILKPFESVKAGDLTATPVLAQHMSDQECFFYSMEKDGRKFLYVSDTGPFCEESWEYVLSQKYDLIISECTIGTLPGEDCGHMRFRNVVDMRNRLAEGGALKDSCELWLTHFSHNIRMTHQELVDLAAGENMKVGYDGAILEI